MKVFIDEDERYPVYVARKEGRYLSFEVEMTEAAYAQGKQIEWEYNQWQEKLAALCKEAQSK